LDLLLARQEIAELRKRLSEAEKKLTPDLKAVQ